LRTYRRPRTTPSHSANSIGALHRSLLQTPPSRGGVRVPGGSTYGASDARAESSGTSCAHHWISWPDRYGAGRRARERPATRSSDSTFVAGIGSRGDILDRAAVERAIDGCIGVVHLAAVSRVIDGERAPEVCWRTNVDGTRNVIEAALAELRRPWVIYASSREVYGQPGALPASEDAALAPVNIYGRSKVAAEDLTAKADLVTAIVRFSNVYGWVGDHADRVVPAFARQAAAGLPLRVDGSGHTFDFTHLDDTVRGVLAVVAQLEAGATLPPLHFVTGTPTTLGHLASLAVELAGAGSPVVEGAPRSFDVSRFHGDPSRAAAVLGWRPAGSTARWTRPADRRLPRRAWSAGGGVMRILKVIHGYPRRYNAGSEVYSQTLCQALAARHEVHVFTREENPFAPPYALSEDVDPDDPRVPTPRRQHGQLQGPVSARWPRRGVRAGARPGAARRGACRAPESPVDLARGAGGGGRDPDRVHAARLLADVPARAVHADVPGRPPTISGRRAMARTIGRAPSDATRATSRATQVPTITTWASGPTG
jgi:UDP-glucose 4-epimerase